MIVTHFNDGQPFNVTVNMRRDARRLAQVRSASRRIMRELIDFRQQYTYEERRTPELRARQEALQARRRLIDRLADARWARFKREYQNDAAARDMVSYLSAGLYLTL